MNMRKCKMPCAFDRITLRFLSSRGINFGIEVEYLFHVLIQLGAVERD